MTMWKDLSRVNQSRRVMKWWSSDHGRMKGRAGCVCVCGREEMGEAAEVPTDSTTSLSHDGRMQKVFVTRHVYLELYYCFWRGCM